MSSNVFRRKTIKPVIDFDDDEDDRRRGVSGRKRVDVIQCLLESSSDEDLNIIDQTSHQVLWLTFAEICHIRRVLAQTALSTLMFNDDKKYAKIIHGDVCFRCRKPTHSFFFLPSFLSSTNSFICYICQQRFCRKCALSNFLPPLLRHSFPVRLQTLIKTTVTTIEKEENQPDQQRKTICYDCSQVFEEHRRPSQYHIKPLVTELLQSFSTNLNRSQCLSNGRLSLFATRF